MRVCSLYAVLKQAAVWCGGAMQITGPAPVLWGSARAEPKRYWLSVAPLLHKRAAWDQRLGLATVV
jgi:hypothetical protein